MKQYIEQIFKFGYREFSGKSNKDYGAQTKENIKLLCDEIKAFITPNNLKVADPGIGTGGWAAVPYVRVFDEKEAPSATNGVYIVYLFADTEKSVFLTLNQGVENSSREAIVLNRSEIQKRIDAKDFVLNNKKIKELRDYGESTIFYKEYKRDALPSEDDLQKDLKTMVNVYKKYLDSKKTGDTGGTEIPVPKIETDSSAKQAASDNPISGQKNDGKFLQIQRILFGAPGTGKSFKIDDPVNGYGLKNVGESRKFRTTFHPDYDYAQFVGAYKPKKEGKDITYSFVPQVFAKAYAAAWKLHLTNAAEINVFLVIEEINRGNCAQIFGDIFQLLDRDEEGFSQYSIDADNDFATWLKEESVLKDVWPNYVDKVGEGKLKLPPNLNILATMNTSDQSLFPMDSAFKRRFDWEYVPISFDGKDAVNFQIDIDGTQYSWQKFVETVNEKILTLTESEDKQLGEFFIKPDSGKVISKDRFLGKVMFYLWNEVCKDEHKNGSFFQAKDESGKVNYFTFQDLYRDEGLLKRFMDELLKKDA